MRLFFICIVLSLLLAGCASQDGLPRNYRSFNAKDIPNAKPRVETKSRYGNSSSYIVRGKRYHVLKTANCYHAKGIASWYGTMFHERLTSSREPYNMYKMTAANKVLPLPTFVRVHDLTNGRTIIVKVNDRGPFHPNRIIDLSFAAAKKIGMLAKGTALVEIAAIDPKHPNRICGQRSADRHAKGRHQIYLQLGAFTTKQNADKLANRIVRYSNEPISVKASKETKGYLYKVLVGPLKNVKQADGLSAKFKSVGLGNAYAVLR